MLSGNKPKENILHPQEKYSQGHAPKENVAII